jgi:hypothetical protein
MPSVALTSFEAPSTRRGSRSRRASLSVVLMTRGPGARVAALLQTLRPVADEVLVALDDRADQSVRDARAAVADRIVLFPFAEPVDRPLAWLFEQCRAEWALVLDDDEIPSVALIEALPELCAARDVTHYSVPRRWLFPDESTYLDDAPWRPDYQLRLLRTDPRFVQFSDEFHRPIVARGPGRFPEEPLWHADTMLRSYEERLQKARRYEQMRPAMRIGSRSLNFAFYLPELRREPRLAAVPEDDRALIESVLSAGSPTRAGTAEIARVTRGEIDARWPTTDPTAQSGRLELLERPRELTAGEQRTVDVRVHNTGDAAWPWGWDAVPQVRMGSRWYSTNGAEVRSSQLRSALPATLEPGETTIVPVHVLAPDEPGEYRVEIDVIHEHVRWFGATVDFTAFVRPRRRIAVVGDDAQLGSVAQLLETIPELELVALRRSPTDLPDGFPEAADARQYLFDEAPRSRPAFMVTLAWRSLRLITEAMAFRLGRPPRLPRLGGEFLCALASCELLIVAGLDAPDHRRERRRLNVTTRTAAILGVDVAHGSEPGELLPILMTD